MSKARASTWPASEASVLKGAFYLLGILGTLVTWGRVLADGSVALLQASLEDPNYLLPGTKHPLRPTFTGIPPLDYLLRTLVVFFWEAVDGSHPKNSAAGIYFGAQLFPVIVTLYLDSQRQGNKPSLLRPSLWFLSFSAAAIGCSGAAWALLYTAASPTVSSTVPLAALQQASLVASPATAGLLLPAAVVGYALPLVLMGLPSPALVSNQFQQWAIVAWNAFPLLLLAAVRVGEPLVTMSAWFRRRSAPSSPSSVQTAAPQHLRTVRWLGAGAVAVGFAMHIAVAAVSFAAALFPAMFADGYAEALHPLELAIPPVGITPAQGVGDGIWGFMVWDQVAGFTIVLLVMLAQLRTAVLQTQTAQVGEVGSGGYKEFSWTLGALGALVISLVMGPGTAVMVVSWARDEMLYGVKASELGRAGRKA